MTNTKNTTETKATNTKPLTVDDIHLDIPVRVARKNPPKGRALTGYERPSKLWC